MFMAQCIDKVWRLGGYDSIACEWGVEISCARIDMLNENALRQIGEHLVKSQVVVIRDQRSINASALQKMCLEIGDLEGYNLGDGSAIPDPDTPWSADGRSKRQLYNDYNVIPGVMRVTGKLNKDGGQTGFFGHDSELGWHCDKASNANRHSHVTLYSVSGSEGSKTSWLDTTQAYVDLPEEKKEYYKTLNVVCGYRKGSYSEDPTFIDHINKDVTWPLVQKKYGKIGLYFPFNQVFNFIGCDNFEEEFEYLKNHILQEKYMYHHYWRDGDIILSDQDVTLHKRWEFKNIKDRLVWRCAHGVDNIIGA